MTAFGPAVLCDRAKHKEDTASPRRPRPGAPGTPMQWHSIRKTSCDTVHGTDYEVPVGRRMIHENPVDRRKLDGETPAK